MAEHLEQSIRDLEEKLKVQLGEVKETKSGINLLCKLANKPERYTDVESDSLTGFAGLRPDSFFGKALATAVGEFLRMQGHAAPVSEIYAGLNKGGYDFGDARYPERVLRVSLGKNSTKFVPIKGSDSFGLREWYPNLRQEKSNGKTQSPRDAYEETLADNPMVSSAEFETDQDEGPDFKEEPNSNY